MGKEPIYRVITFAYCKNQIAIRIKLCVSLPKSVLPKSVKAICRFNMRLDKKEMKNVFRVCEMKFGHLMRTYQGG